MKKNTKSSAKFDSMINLSIWEKNNFPVPTALGKYVIMKIMKYSDEMVNLKEIYYDEQFSYGGVRKAIQKLKIVGLIVLEQHPQNKRVKCLKVSPSARELFDAYVEQLHKTHHELNNN
jgi:DNA-binding MarR family transcriptional regulator